MLRHAHSRTYGAAWLQPLGCWHPAPPCSAQGLPCTFNVRYPAPKRTFVSVSAFVLDNAERRDACVQDWQLCWFRQPVVAPVGNKVRCKCHLVHVASAYAVPCMRSVVLRAWSLRCVHMAHEREALFAACANCELASCSYLAVGGNMLQGAVTSRAASACSYEVTSKMPEHKIIMSDGQGQPNPALMERFQSVVSSLFQQVRTCSRLATFGVLLLVSVHSLAASHCATSKRCFFRSSYDSGVHADFTVRTAGHCTTHHDSLWQ